MHVLEQFPAGQSSYACKVLLNAFKRLSERYSATDRAADISSGHNIRSTVFIETRSMYRTDEPEEFRTVGEVEFFQGLENTRSRQRVRIRLEIVYQLVHVFAVVRKYIEVCIGFIPSDGPSCRMSCIIA